MSIASTARTAIDRASWLMFPPSCFACGGRSERGRLTDGLCDACRNELVLFDQPLCPRCAMPSGPLDEGATCARCRGDSLGFDGAFAVGAYSGMLRQLVLDAKRPNGDAIALGLGALVADRLAQSPHAAGVDVVTAAPMHWRRRVWRRANSPELMAAAVARRLGAPAAPRLLRRVRATRPQATVAPSQRPSNVRAAFALRPGHRLLGATVALVDDILTTGATCGEAARTLKRAGAARVVVVVAARTLS